MSKVIFKCHDRELAHVIETNSGEKYYIDSVESEFIGCETMAFKVDDDFNTNLYGSLYGSVNWKSNYYCETFKNIEEMEKRHNYLINNFEKVSKKQEEME